MDPAIDAWVRAHITPAGPAECVSDEAWATVWRVPAGGSFVFCKHCAPVQAFEPRLTAELSTRWPDRVARVLAHDIDARLLLLADAGMPLSARGNPPEVWEELLPRYAELQRGETAHAADHLAEGVPDLRVATLPERYDTRLLAAADFPLDGEEIAALRRYAPRFHDDCERLDALGIAPSVQHDDLHAANVYLDGDAGAPCVLDWGDASIGHPFTSLVVPFRFLEETNGLPPGDPWFARLRDAYLEPWGTGLVDAFDLAIRVGAFAYALAWLRQRDALPLEARVHFDTGFAIVLRRALSAVGPTRIRSSSTAKNTIPGP